MAFANWYTIDISLYKNDLFFFTNQLIFFDQILDRLLCNTVDTFN